MSSSKVYSYHELIKKVLDYDSRFEIRYGGRHPKIYHTDVDGRKKSFPILSMERISPFPKVTIRK